MEADDSQPATKGDLRRAVEALSFGHGKHMEGFDGRMANLGDRMDGLDGRMAKFEDRMDGLDDRMAKFEDRMDGFDGRMTKFEYRMDVLDRKIDRVAIVVVRNEARMDRFETNMATKDEIKSYMKVLHDIASRTEALMRIATIHGQALTEGQTTLKDHERRLGALES